MRRAALLTLLWLLAAWAHSIHELADCHSVAETDCLVCSVLERTGDAAPSIVAALPLPLLLPLLPSAGDGRGPAGPRARHRRPPLRAPPQAVISSV